MWRAVHRAAGTPVVTFLPVDLAGICEDEGPSLRIHPSLSSSVGCAAPCIPILQECGGSSGARWVWVPTFPPGCLPHLTATATILCRSSPLGTYIRSLVAGIGAVLSIPVAIAATTARARRRNLT